MPFRGDRLTGIREFKNLRRSDLARLAGRDPAGIQHLEEGTTRNPRLDTVETLAEKLDITTDYLSGVGPDLPYARAAVLQALERFKRTEGWKFSPLDEAALSRAAEHEDAFHTVAQWRSFVVMSSLAWGKAPRMLKLDHRTPASAQLPTRKAAEPGKDARSSQAESVGPSVCGSVTNGYYSAIRTQANALPARAANQPRALPGALPLISR